MIAGSYRTPRSCNDQFSMKISQLYEKQSGKSILVCGDFNIDPLKSNEHK